MQFLSTKEYAELQGCTFQSAQKLIKDGKLEAIESRNEKNRKKYLIPLSALSPALQRKWYRAHQMELPPELRRRLPEATPADSRTLEEMSEAERQQVAWWVRILDGWEAARREGNKAEADARYIDMVAATEGVKLSYSSLMRHAQARAAEN